MTYLSWLRAINTSLFSQQGLFQKTWVILRFFAECPHKLFVPVSMVAVDQQNYNYQDDDQRSG